MIYMIDKIIYILYIFVKYTRRYVAALKKTNSRERSRLVDRTVVEQERRTKSVVVVADK